jgi:hypothetical protein
MHRLCRHRSRRYSSPKRRHRLTRTRPAPRRGKRRRRLCRSPRGNPPRPSPGRGQDHSPARQGAHQIRVPPALRRVRPHAGRPESSSIRPAPRARTKGQRRIHGPRLSHASSRTA